MTAERVLAEATPSPMFANHVFMSTFAGPEVSRLDAYGNGPDRVGDYLAASPSRMCNLAQHLLEPLLVAEVERAGVGSLRCGQEFQRLERGGEGVTSVLRDRRTGREWTVRSEYVVGADGGRSRCDAGRYSVTAYQRRSQRFNGGADNVVIRILFSQAPA